MNRIYKVIFNRAKGQHQVVSELAKNGGKTSGNSLLRTIIKSGGVLTSTVLTAVLVFGSALYGSAESVQDGDILKAGTNISVTKDETTKTITISTDGVATSVEVDAVKKDVQKNQTAIADNTGKIADNSTEIANNKIRINQNYKDIQQNKTDIAANKNAITANTGKIKNNTDDITELKNVNSALGLDQTKPGIKYFRANSTGEDAAAAGEDAVAIGVRAKANGKDSVALGDDARSASSAENSIAIGRKAVSGSFNDMTGDGDSSNVVKDGGKASISIGDAANARGNSSIALGDGATVYNDGTNDQLNDNSMAIGTKASTVASNNAIAMGNNAAVTQNSHSAAAIGDSAKAEAEGALALGKSTAASGADSIAVGTEAAASGADALAMGKNAQASGADAVALGNGVVKYDLNDDINLNSVTAKTINGDTIKAGDTTITTDGMTITNGPSITKTGIDAGSKKITNVADGDISPTSKDAINGSQLVSYVAANKTILKDGKNTTVTGNGTKDDPYKVNVNDNLNLGEKGTNGKDGSIGVNGTNGSSVTINGKDGSIGMVGEDGKDGLTMKSAKGQDGVDGANGMTRIVYEDDGHVTHEVATLDDGLKFAGNTGSVAKKLNSTMTIKGNGTKADTEYDASNIKTVVDAQGDLVIGLDKNLKADTVTVGGQGKDGADGINGAIGVKGADGKDGVTISSIGKDGTNGTDGHIGINGKDGASADIHVVKGANGVDGTDGYNGTDGIDRIVYEDHNGNTQTVATMNDGMKYGGDVGNVINKKLNGQVNVVGGITDSSKLSTEDNIGVVSDGSDNLKVRLSKDLKGLDSVTTKTVTADTGNITTVNASTVNVGDTTITTGGMTIQNGSAGQDVTLNKDGLNNGGNKITNVAPGDISSTSTDAVNGSQLYGTETRINRLGNRINHVGAGAAALAGLHPLDFDPDDKWDFAAGYGNYKNANAVAIGAYYRPNEDTMFSVGGSFSGGENMVNVGVSWKFGQKSHISRSRVSMAKDMLAMKNQIETLTKKLAAYESGQPVKLAPIATGAMTFPDVPENHWAYEYVKNLAERGYLKGYPDGEFKGDRAMTRYEYAAIIYRALQNGAPSDGNMTRSVDDFGPELVKVQNIDRFRVDRISGK